MTDEDARRAVVDGSYKLFSDDELRGAILACQVAIIPNVATQHQVEQAAETLRSELNDRESARRHRKTQRVAWIAAGISAATLAVTLAQCRGAAPSARGAPQTAAPRSVSVQAQPPAAASPVAAVPLARAAQAPSPKRSSWDAIVAAAERFSHFFAPRLPEWLTAIGTIGAAVSAVWLGLRDRAIRLSVAAGLASLEGAAAEIYGNPRAIVVDLANRGTRRAVVNGAYWEVGWRWWRPEPVPILSPGTGSWPLRIESGDGSIIVLPFNDLLRTLLPACQDRGTRRVRLYVHTATGKEFRCCLNKATKKWLWKVTGTFHQRTPSPG
jgi:hypothetical protein